MGSRVGSPYDAAGTPGAILVRLGAAADGMVPLAEAALALAALERPAARPGPYRDFLKSLASDLTKAGSGLDGSDDRGACLAELLTTRHRFEADDGDEDELDGGNLMSVIDRRRGGPEALGILYIEAARRSGWKCEGLSFPGHFLVRLEDEAGRRTILDPFANGIPVDAPTMRALLKAGAGLAAELRPAHYVPLGNRQILVRLQNELKLRLLRSGRIDRALEVVEAILLFAPGETLLWREAGLMHMRLDNPSRAVAALEQFVARTSNAHARRRALALVQEIRGRLN